MSQSAQPPVEILKANDLTVSAVQGSLGDFICVQAKCGKEYRFNPRDAVALAVKLMQSAESCFKHEEARKNEKRPEAPLTLEQRVSAVERKLNDFLRNKP